ncbi:MAG: 3-phosphoshikimate 1-carboxyvinyltransferase [Candidatus Omnitrophica bacterium]|nr:3-phosphoshikimate 1-carboxyvinyltransferase [Candidatus Omnitrophota bacterium]
MAKQIKIKRISKLTGQIIAPADKSISQRAIMFSALAQGKTKIINFLDCADCRNAISAFKAMGIKFKKTQEDNQTVLYVQGNGLHGLKAPKKSLYIGNSGTTMRLLAGILAGMEFETVLTADLSLSKRPMKRIIDPLREMGAKIFGIKRNQQEYPPLKINKSDLHPIKYKMLIKSAQVKSCILLAGLFANGKTIIKELLKTRDHTERMLQLFKADIKVEGLNVSIKGNQELISPGKIFIPGDISSAAFFIVAAALIKGSKITIKQVGLNPSRVGFLDIMRRMQADVKILKKGAKLNLSEPYADIQISASKLKAVTIGPKEVAYCIDELPIICVAACFAQGTTKIVGASELRVKETDRIYSMVTNLKKMGANIKSIKDDLIIIGNSKLSGAVLDSYGDHRTVMCMAVAGLLADGITVINNSECIDKSFPEFMKILKSITELT